MSFKHNSQVRLLVKSKDVELRAEHSRDIAENIGKNTALQKSRIGMMIAAQSFILLWASELA